MRALAAGDLGPIMALVSGGDQAAFADFYDATSRTVFGIALRVLRDAAQAEEVAQEVFLEAWRTAARYDPHQGTAAAWINTIAHRRAVDRVRSVERSVQRDQRHAEAEGAIPAPDVSEEVVSRDMGNRVRRALARLPEGQRRPLALAYYDGRSQREVAEIMGLPLGTVKTRMRDAMRKLRTYLDEDAT
jgi:RNA polymerase sigma-70 factor (ECF subfamily)